MTKKEYNKISSVINKFARDERLSDGVSSFIIGSIVAELCKIFEKDSVFNKQSFYQSVYKGRDRKGILT